MAYVLIVISTLLFSLQFFFQQNFQKIEGSGAISSFCFTAYSSLIGIIISLSTTGFRLGFSGFTVLIAFLSGLNGIIMSYCSIKAFSTINLSVYSVFSMLGGMMLPFVFGIIFYNESLTFLKVLCVVLIAASLFLTMDKTKRNDKKAYFYYAGIFFFNGMSGVLAKIHQSGADALENGNYLAYTHMTSFLICAAIVLVKKPSALRLGIRSIALSAGNSILNTAGNLLLLIALMTLPASIQYPMVTGGVIVFSFLISLLQKEKFTWRSFLALVIAVVSTVLLAF